MENSNKDEEVKKTPQETLNNPNKEDVVQIPKADWEKIVRKIDELEKDRDVLKEVADKGRLDRVENLRKQGKLIKTVRVSVLKGKKIIAWSTVSNTVDYDVRGVPHEDQIVELIFEDKTKEKLRLVSKARTVTYITGEVTKESRDQDGRVSYTVLFDDGSTLDIAETFVN
jgi:hypothetical protein